MTEMKQVIAKTREYLDYIEEHYDNVQKAFKVVEEKCSDMWFIMDDCRYFNLKEQVKWHDYSKLCIDEFVQYRRAFFKTDLEKERYNNTEDYNTKERVDKDFNEAWSHHQNGNAHHWQSLHSNPYHPYAHEANCAHMVIDWIAMGMKFGDTAKEYYENNKDEIQLPEWAENMIYEIFDRVYGENK